MLHKILQHKRQEVLNSKKAKRHFFKALKERVNNKEIAVIAEIKKASPSLGIIQPNFDPVAIAKAYTEGGATCLSVLTDQHFFQGDPTYIQAVKAVSPLPVLRKDFIIDAYQIYESKVLGADAILLIVAALKDSELKKFYNLANKLELDVLVEVHDEQELKRALALNPPCIGINNRNLKTFEVNIQTTLELLPKIPKELLVISESGIHNTEDIQKLCENGVYAFLIGEALMRSNNPKEKLQELQK